MLWLFLTFLFLLKSVLPAFDGQMKLFPFIFLVFLTSVVVDNWLILLLVVVAEQVQVIPWVISDSNYVRCPSQRLDPSKTVFVGALHGMLNAEALASIMNDLFGGVMYAGIDTDKHKYPIGNAIFSLP